jgi:uncharacterized protein
MLEAPSPALSAIRARTVLGLLVVSVIALVLIPAFVWPAWTEEETAGLVDPILELGIYLLWAALLWLVCVRAGVHRHFRLGALPARTELGRYVLLSLPLVLVSLAALYLVYLPLSYMAPEFVSEFLLKLPPSLQWDEPEANILIIALTVISMVVVAPIVEEVVFRGFLLNRWWKKYGLRRSIAFSSVLFALVHLDVVGALLFGIISSILFIKTGSLYGPITVHIINNTIVLIVFCIGWLVTGEIEDTSVEEFRSFWWLGALGLIIGVPWLLWSWNRYLRWTGKPLGHDQPPEGPNSPPASALHSVTPPGRQ